MNGEIFVIGRERGREREREDTKIYSGDLPVWLYKYTAPRLLGCTEIFEKVGPVSVTV